MTDSQTAALFTLLAALLGAVVGAFATGVTTFFVARAARRHEERAAARLLLITLGRIYSSLSATYRQIVEGIRRAEELGVEGALHDKMLSMTTSAPIIISDQQMAILLDIKAYAFLQRFIGIDEKHNTLLRALAYYSARRTSLYDQLPATMVGQKGEVRMGVDDYALIAPRRAELEMMAFSLLSDFRRYAIETKALIEELGPLLRQGLRDKTIPLLSPYGDLPDLPTSDCHVEVQVPTKDDERR